MPSLFIDGGAGTTGLEIRERLTGRDDFTLILLDDAERKDARHRRAGLNDADFVILCLPDDAARAAVAMIDNPAVRVIDASSAHRTTPGWTYGLPELDDGQAAAIAGAARVTNPGCYASGFIALVAPLVARGLIAADARLSVTGISGYSGGGRALIARYQADPALSFRSYALTLAHKHAPEMQHVCGLTRLPLFAPAVVPALRGMLVEVPIIAGTPIASAITNTLTDHYAGSPLIQVHSRADSFADGEILLRADAAPWDGMDLIILSDASGTMVRLIARLDNLGKGASGACVQNLNLMAGLDPLAGLRL